MQIYCFLKLVLARHRERSVEYWSKLTCDNFEVELKFHSTYFRHLFSLFRWNSTTIVEHWCRDDVANSHKKTQKLGG